MTHLFGCAEEGEVVVQRLFVGGVAVGVAGSVEVRREVRRGDTLMQVLR
ncbi:hypothetical protein OV079_23255 [Nannocystis pusilla]|uniref:Uncharacterized protein n=1 Tax=Nannocystis pusilla TaxID=889268 RepID=A0A9X3ER58_9BACT|nr:hypothetical protein [Nannocystis pusilla]MCY1008420.1 hypothetical protein [Nannocystis pusilla]